MPTVVSRSAGANVEGSSGNTIADTTTSTIPAGDKVFVTCGWFGTQTPTSVSGGGLTWSAARALSGGAANSLHTVIFTADAPAGLASSTTLTFTLSANPFARSIHIASCDGLVNEATGPDATAATAVASGTNWTQNITTVAASTVVFGHCIVDASAAALAASGCIESYEWHATDSNQQHHGVYEENSSAGVQTIGGTFTGTLDRAISAVSYAVSGSAAVLVGRSSRLHHPGRRGPTNLARFRKGPRSTEMPLEAFTGTATLSATGSLSSAGVVGTVAASASSATGTLSAAGLVGALASAALAVTGTLTGAGLVGVSSGASIAATAAVSASGVVGTGARAGFEVTAADNWTPNMTGGVVQLGPRRFAKTGGSSAWDGQVYSSEGYVNDAWVTFWAENPDHRMVGLNSDPTTDASWASLDYAWYTNAGGPEWHIWENGAQVGGSYGALTTNDIADITYDGTNVRYYLNGVLKRTAARATGAALYLDSTFYTSPEATGIRQLGFGPLAAYTVLVDPPITATITAAGIVAASGSATLSTTDTITATGTMAADGQASVAATGTVTGSGIVGTSAAASLAETGTLVAAGDVGVYGDAPLSATGTIAASGSVGAAELTGTADLAATATVTTTGEVGAAASATLAATDSLAASGVLGASSSAPLAATGTITATGQVGTFGSATLAASATITADGVAEAIGTGSASLDATAALTATGTVGAGYGATVAATGALSASGQVGTGAAATLAGTAGLSSAGTLGLNAPAAVTATFVITAAGQVGASASAALAATATITAVGPHVPADPSRSADVPAETRVVAVVAEDRSPAVPAETRTADVTAEDRHPAEPAETRGTPV